LEDFEGIINWENLFKKSEEFKNNQPVHYSFIEEIFERKFYEKLYETYPKFDNTWIVRDEENRYGTSKDLTYTYSNNSSNPEELEDDPTLSKEWNKFRRYTVTPEFSKNFTKFSGIKLTGPKEKTFNFIALEKGGFQLPHIDRGGNFTNKLQTMLYFSKGWEKGDHGGTYLSKDEDESSIYFEPFNLDNTLVCFEENLQAWHGTRYITKDVRRQAVAIGID